MYCTLKVGREEGDDVVVLFRTTDLGLQPG